MKRNNVAKKLGIASLCLATAISAFSGISSFKNDSVALAEDTTTSFSVTDWITITDGASEGAKVEKESRTVYLKKNASQGAKNCLRVSSAVPYEAKFNHVFHKGSTVFRFAFPEVAAEDATSTYYGDFRFRIADAIDSTQFFDVVYKPTANGTTCYVEWNGNTVQGFIGSSNSITTTGVSIDYFYNDIDTRASANVAPSFMNRGTFGKREGRLGLYWADDVLRVFSNSTQKQDTSDSYGAVVAKFDGSYDETKTKNGFVDGSKWGLPKMDFTNGFTVSFMSDYGTGITATDQASDVSFWKFYSQDKWYEFTSDTVTKYNQSKAYEAISAPENAGKALLGWKDAEGALHSTTTALASADISAYTPVFLGFNRISGASVRIDTVDGNSGLRFITGFNPDEYALAKDYITSFGTLVAYTDSLTEGLFDVTNYATQLAATENIKVLQQPNTKGTFEYEHQGVTYTAYSVALVGLTNFTQSYSARGYIEVAYADGTTATIYTLFNETDNSRSIAQTAYNLKTIGAAEYNTYSDAQKAIVDTYAAPLETAE